VIQKTSIQPGRDKLRGIFNYAHLYRPWHLHLVHGRSGEQKPTDATDWNRYGVREICTRCGYQTDVHLRRIFKRRFGCSMRDYRNRLCKL